MRILTQTLLALFATLPSTYAATLILGDTTGNARGTNSIDIQSFRSGPTEVTSGSGSVSVGISNTTTGNEGVSFGLYNSTAGYYNVNLGSSNYTYASTVESAVVGLGNEVTGAGGLAFGYCNVVFDNYGYANPNNGWYQNLLYSSAFGSFNSIEAAATKSYVFGRGNTATATNTGIFGADITNGVSGSMMIGPSDAAKVTILTSGNVGIGTSAPTSKLHVVGDLNVTGTIVNSGIATTGSGSTARLRVGGTVNPASSWQGTTVIGADGQNKVIAGYVTSNTNGATIGAHNSALNAWADLNVTGSNVILRTNETERMRVAGNGNVGINTTNPLAKLQVDTATNGLNFPLALKNRDFTETGGNAVAIGFLNEGDGNGGWWKAAIAHERKGSYGVGSLHFLVNNSTTNATTTLADARMTITKEGNVGVGTTTPTEKFQVSGNIETTSSFLFKGLQTGSIAKPLVLTNWYGMESLVLRHDSATNLADYKITFRDSANGLENLSYGRYGVGLDSANATFNVFPASGQTSDIFRVNLNTFKVSASGNVGINTASPTEKLEVSGNAKVSGTLTVGGASVLTSAGGSGANLTGLNAANISTGSLSASRLPTEAVQRDAVQTLTNKTLSGAQLTGTTTLAGGTVVNGSGDVNVGGSLNVAGATTLNGVTSINDANAILFPGAGVITRSGSSDLKIGRSYPFSFDNTLTVAAATVRIDAPNLILGSDASGSYYSTTANVTIRPGTSGSLSVQGKSNLGGDVAITGNTTVKNRAVIRVSAAGDIGMGSFTSGTNPEL